MSLNIKSERVHALAREAAEALGTSQTSAVEQALVEMLERHRQAAAPDVRRRVTAILEDVDRLLGDDDRVALRRHDDLYDHRGLPA